MEDPPVWQRSTRPFRFCRMTIFMLKLDNYGFYQKYGKERNRLNETLSEGD